MVLWSSFDEMPALCTPLEYHDMIWPMALLPTLQPEPSERKKKNGLKNCLTQSHRCWQPRRFRSERQSIDNLVKTSYSCGNLSLASKWMTSAILNFNFNRRNCRFHYWVAMFSSSIINSSIFKWLSRTTALRSCPPQYEVMKMTQAQLFENIKFKISFALNCFEWTVYLVKYWICLSCLLRVYKMWRQAP